ncbi:MAG TPA: OB-fold nucleic acid binding domain-containing protein, partial [Gammaproteobacteria bacterium]
MAEQDKDAAAPVDENHIIAERRAKLAKLREAGIAYPNDFERTTFILPLDEAHGATETAALEAQQVQATIAGRLMLKRVMGKASFGQIQDGSGKLQIYVSDDNTGKESHAAFKHWDIGDILGVSGFLFKTRTGELTLRAHEIRLLAKSLRPLPEKFHGLADQETRY